METIYQVIVTRFDSEQQKQIDVVAGTFDRYIYASLFRDAYYQHYKTMGRIEEVKKPDA